MLFVPIDRPLTPDRQQHIICQTRDVRLPDFTLARREPTRPPQFRGDNFDREFDATTLFYDAVDLGKGEAVLLAPPFLNLAGHLAATTFFSEGKPCRAEIKNLDRHAQIWLQGVRGETLRAAGPLGDFTLRLSRHDHDLFAGRRVTFTMSKDNPIEWILDWVRFNRDVHGADAVLIYDNGSTSYDGAALSEALQSMAGLACAIVVEWPFRYGPQGSNARDHWDSDFCQLGAWEHARWCFLQHARSAMNSDIDELVLSRSGRSVFEAAERSPLGFVRYKGRWIIGVDGHDADSGDRLPRHRDFSILMPPDYSWSWLRGRRDLNRCLAKWTVVPARCPRHVQWHVHGIASWLPSYLPCSRNFSFGHFREIGSNWKYQRTSRVAFDPAVHVADQLLLKTCARVDWTS
jgi:hypothetical protein